PAPATSFNDMPLEAIKSFSAALLYSAQTFSPSATTSIFHRARSPNARLLHVCTQGVSQMGQPFLACPPDFFGRNRILGLPLANWSPWNRP
ncbi:MAG TPA: hypothetical protein VE092_15950, partial [Herbaspirillum sp.]|uniref:hypothetical protein n=1 Tax=Herbaspirillum sp. TaxID=1890675 RepID=UPI002D28801F